MQNMIVAALICPLAGATLKLADVMSERQNNRTLCFLTSGTAGCLIGLLITFDAFSSAVFSGIVLGVVLAGKVDQPCLGFGLIVTVLTAWLAGPKEPALTLLLITILASFADEIGHDRYPGGGRFSKFLEYRGILKLMIGLSYLLGILPFYSSCMFYLFDVAYDLSSRVLEPQE
ncbi:hypothetical protein ISS96_02745 [Candidatus Bathyarchaeota archaeon]|nr:hypothetical protein [Candidatus Bathyarchaeota archaeon]